MQITPMAMDDTLLLRRYVHERADDAFAELVRRHVNLVYFAALRQCGGNATLAEEITQSVFTDLARKAAQLTHRPVLAGWLYTSTRYAAAKARRTEARRHAREQEAFAMQEITRNETDEGAAAEWERLRPAIDDALHTLDETDREAVLLRFFEGRAFAEIGAALRLSEDAARKRVGRALDKLAIVLAQRGVTSTSAALALALGQQVAAAAPAGMAASITGAALASSAAAGGKTGALAAAAAAGVWSASKVAVIVASVIVTATALVFTLGQARAEKAARAELIASASEQQMLAVRVRDLQEKHAIAEQRARAADGDATELLKAIQEASPKIGFPGGDAVAVAFVIDTSGSMRNPKKGQLWSGVFDAIKDVLAAHREATFVTLYDGDGRPMFGRRGWLAINSETLAAIEQVLGGYQQDTVSNPVPGIYNAMREAPPPLATGPRLHVCVIGDEFNSAEKEEVALRRLQEINTADAGGKRRATISAVQLPTTMRANGGPMGNTGLRFQALMTEVAQQHAGNYKLLGSDALK
jgi:RNA polymerase sigma factor (sigma-70 family)